MKEQLNTLTSVIHSFLPDAKVILFGSRARGDHHINSDYDILIITKQGLSMDTKRKLRETITNSFRHQIHLLISSQEQIEIEKNIPGHVVRWAMKDGIELK